MKHLEITFVNGTVEKLESAYALVDIHEGVLNTYKHRVGGSSPKGPSYPLANVRKFEWVEGFR